MTVEIIVDNRVRVQRSSEVDEDVVAALKQEFKHDNPEYASRLHFGLPLYNVPKHYITWEETPTEISLPRGGLQRVRDVLTEFKREWTIDDQRFAGAPDAIGEIPDHLIQPYEHQQECVDAALMSEQGIIKAPTGSGKTVVVFETLSRWKVASLVILPNSTLFRQWLKRIPVELGLDLRDIGFIKGTKFKLRPITLTMPQTLSKRLKDPRYAQKIKDYFGAVVADEAQLFAAETFYGSVDPMPARYRIAVSADHTRKDRKEFLIYDIFGDVLKSITRKRLEKAGVIVNVEIWVIPTDFRADWYGVPEDKEDDKSLNFDGLLMAMLRDEERNKHIYETVSRVVREEGKQILVFSHRREHAAMIDRTLNFNKFKTGFLLGGKEDEREFVKTLDGLSNRTLDVGVGTFQATGTGLDLPHISVGLAATPIGGNRQFFNQVRGRFARTVKDGSEEKLHAKLFYIWDRHVYPSHLKNITKWNDKVFVWTGTSWMSARHYLERET